LKEIVRRWKGSNGKLSKGGARGPDGQGGAFPNVTDREGDGKSERKKTPESKRKGE